MSAYFMPSHRPRHQKRLDAMNKIVASIVSVFTVTSAAFVVSDFRLGVQALLVE